MNKLFKVLLIIEIILWLIITIMVPFKNIDLQPLFVITLSILFITIIFSMYKLFSKLNKKVIDIISIVTCIVYFILLCYVGLKGKVSLPYDLDIIYDQIKIMFDDNTTTIFDSSYLSVYPHQIPLFCLLYYVGSIGNLLNIDPINIIIIFNCLMISISLLFIYKIVYLITNKSAISLLALLLMLLIPDFMLYSCYFYTDIISIPFSLIGMYYILKGNINNKNILLFIGGLVFAISIKVRILNLIILLAFFIYNFFNKKIKDYIKSTLIILSSLIVFNLIYTNLIYSNFNFKLDKKTKFPATHWVMIGLNEKRNGMFGLDDYEITYNSNDKVKTNINEIKKRIRKNSPLFYLKKEINVFSVSDHNILDKYKTINNYSSFNKMINSKYSIYIKYLQEISILSIYILFIFSMIYTYKNKNIFKEKSLIFFLTILGGLIFYLFWESHPRYGLMFIPWIVIGGIINFDKLSSYLFNNKFLKNYKLIYLLSCIIISGYFVYGYFNYSFKKKKIDTTIYSQEYGNDEINIINNKLKIEFYVEESFDTITCFFTGNSNNNYYFELYNIDDELIYKEKFNNVEIKDFKFNKQIVNKLEKYYIIIYSKDATIDSHLKLIIYTPDLYNKFDTKVGYDINKYEKIFSDNKLLRSEPFIKITLSEKNYLISPYFYIIFCLINLIVMIKIYFKFFNRTIGNRLKDYFQLMRVRHYLKNLLVFAVIIFNKSFLNKNLVCTNILNFCTFSLMSSVIYIFNDIFDLEKDRKHPIKKNRPLAMGKISIKKACILGFILFLLASIINFIPFLFNTNYSLSYSYLCIYVYFIINICYSRGLKNIPILDIFILSFGFIIRVIYGSISTNIEISNWMYLTVMVISLYISLGKRRNEFIRNGMKSRKVLSYYSEDFLNKYMNIFLTSTIVFYSLWANDMNSILFLSSVLIVIFILMRYSLIIDNKLYDDPVDIVLNDRILIILIIIYITYMGGILYAI